MMMMMNCKYPTYRPICDDDDDGEANNNNDNNNTVTLFSNGGIQTM